MRVHLVAPSRSGIPGTKPGTFFAPPLGLAALASVSPPDVEVTITDEQVEPIDFARPADLVGITTGTQTANRAYEIADTFRSKGATVVLGGIHPSMLPEEAGQHADAVVVGEAEETWPRLLSDFREGHLRSLYRADGHPELAGLPAPRRDIFRRRRYLVPDTISTTRGCPFDCSFCTVTSFAGGTYRRRPVVDVVKEIEGLQGRRLVLFVDDNIIGHRGHSVELFRAMARFKLNWIGQASVNIARDDSLLAEARASGCRGLFIGIESISPSSLRAVGKRQNVVEEYEAAIRRIHSHGITILGSFIVGFDEDNEDVFEETVRFAQRNRLEAAIFNIPVPYPGTRLMASLEKEARLLTRDWSQYREDRLVFQPKQMSYDRLLEGREWAWREFYSLGSIFSRVGPTHRWAPMVWALNFSYRTDPVSRLVFDRFAGWISSFL